MGSSKTAQALMMKYNYEQQGKKVMLLKPSVDTRTPPDLVQSRIGLRSKAISVKKNDNIKDICLMNPGRRVRPKLCVNSECECKTERNICSEAA